MKALKGAQNLIKRQNIDLAIAAYHKIHNTKTPEVEQVTNLLRQLGINNITTEYSHIYAKN